LRYSDNLGEQHVELCRELDLLSNGKRFLPSLISRLKISDKIDNLAEWAKNPNIQSVFPGVASTINVETNQTREQLKDPEWAGYMLGKTLLGRLGRPEEVANVALFLASDESSYVIGVDI
jgi:hypothetical protein